MATTPGPITPADWSNAAVSAYDIMHQQLADWGLTSLSATLQGLVSGGVTDANELQLSLEGTDEWKTRFAGNQNLIAKGQAPLDVSTYLSTEQSYAQVMKQYGLPQGFYDDPSDFAKWIGDSVSPSEVQTRMQMYSDLATREDNSVTQQLSSMGMSKGDLMSYMADPDRSLPLLQNKYQTTLLGAAARRAGVTASSNDFLSQLATEGISEQQATSGYGQIAAEMPEAQKLGNIHHESLTQSDLEKATFENNGPATNKLKRLTNEEQAAFSGNSSSGVQTGSLRKNPAGSY
ncbi:MAG: hypothetical protein ACRDRL_15270 [Sciscionella sp.]